MKTLRKLFICLVLSLIVQAVAAPAFAQGFKWWQTEQFQKELKLTKDQITRIEGIYQASSPLLRAQKEAVDRREEKLSKVISDPKSDEPSVIQASAFSRSTYGAVVSRMPMFQPAPRPRFSASTTPMCGLSVCCRTGRTF